MTKFNIEEYLDSLPDDIEIIDVSYKNLTYIPSLDRFTKLIILDCEYNKLINLPNLPNTLEILHCAYNQLTILQCASLPDLPRTLKKLYCHNNKLISLSDLPKTLEVLDCHNNNLINLLNLPNTLRILNCHNNNLTEISNIPNNLQILDCSRNKLTNLPFLPNTLKTINISLNFIYTYIDKNIFTGNSIKKIINTINKFKLTYYKIKYGSKVERYYIKNIRNKHINLELLYSPNLKFYKLFANPLTLKIMKK